jgi:hypothetical protein
MMVVGERCPMDSAAKQEHVSRMIKEAFADLSPPTGVDLVTQNTMGYDAERDDITRFFFGRRWQSLSIDELRCEYSAVHFFSPAAYRYFLPAFMLAVVERFDDADLVTDSLLLTLSPDRPLFRSRVAVLSAQQRQAIRAFLEYLRDERRDPRIDPDPSILLRDYWQGPEDC